ncbi:MAG TPA: hypothetical protein VGH03_21100, partial [Caulobacteraceae bacterium]
MELVWRRRCDCGGIGACSGDSSAPGRGRGNRGGNRVMAEGVLGGLLGDEEEGPDVELTSDA